MMRFTFALSVVVLGAGLAWGADPPSLEQRAAAIEQAAAAPEGDRVVVGHISRTLRISVEVLRTQRTQTGLGWGEILIVDLLSSRGNLTFEQVVAEHAAGRDWGAIARDHGVDLVTLSREVQASQDAVEQRSDDKGPHTNAGDSPAGHGGASGRGGGGRGRRSPPVLQPSYQ
jgi:hypothetical protein